MGKMNYQHLNPEEKENPRFFRIAAGILIPLAMLIPAVFIWIYDPVHPGRFPEFIFCPFYKLTSFYCPGCGTTRALYELMHFNFINAVHDNALTILMIGPGVLYLLIREYLHFVLNRKLLPAPVFKPWMTIMVIVVLLLFTICRNIPVEPFLFLAPIKIDVFK